MKVEEKQTFQIIENELEEFPVILCTNLDTPCWSASVLGL